MPDGTLYWCVGSARSDGSGQLKGALREVASRRILFLDHLDRVSGSQLYLADIVRNLDPSRYDLFINRPLMESFLDRMEGRAQVLPFRIPDVKDEGSLSSLLELAGSALRIARFSAAEGVDIVHTNSIPAQLVGRVVTGLSPARLVWSIHDHFAPVWLMRLLVPRTDMILANSDFLRRFILDSYRAAPGRVTVVPNGVDPRLLQKLASAGCSGLDEDVRWVGLFAQIVGWKGHRLFLEAARKVLQRREDVRFAVLGRGSDSLQKELKELCRTWDISDSISYLGFRQNPFPAMSDMDIVVSCSLRPEPFGRTVIEAGSLDVPVVAFAEGGVSETVVDGETGILVRPRDADALSRAILDLLDDEEGRRRLGRNARRRMESRYSMDRFVRLVDQVYSDLP